MTRVTYEIPSDNDTQDRHQIPINPPLNPLVILSSEDQSLRLESMPNRFNVGEMRVLLIEKIGFLRIHGDVN